MAQVKARPSTKRSQGRKRSPATKKTQAQRSRSFTDRGSNGKARVGAARQTVESSAKEAGKAVSSAKTPLLASGAALVGAAGGLAFGAMRSRRSHAHKVLGLKMPQGKRVKIRSRDVAKAAKEVGTLSQHVSELATELRHVRENSNGGRHRSPVEVVLDGLATRH